jgi:3-deoxy-D-manno-octulosonic-acid transferase
MEYTKNLFTFLVPHEPKETKISIIEKKINSKYNNLRSLRLSNIENYNGENLVIVDCVGKLMNLYSVAYMSYVGGGFRSGLHNVLEPAVFNIPVFFSNEVKNSDEDEILLKSGGGLLVKNQKQFYRDFRRILDDSSLKEKIGMKNKKVFEHKLGTTERILNHISYN